MRLPITAVAIVMIVMIALVAIVGWFVFMGGQAMSRADAEKIIGTQCPLLCGKDPSLVRVENPEFIQACKVLYGFELAAQCLVSACGENCANLISDCELLCSKMKQVCNLGLPACSIYQNLVKSRNCQCKE